MEVLIDYYENENNKFSATKVTIIEIDENKLCSICLFNEKSHMFLPCGHYQFCEYCALKVKN